MQQEDPAKALQPKTPGGLLKINHIERMEGALFNKANDHNPTVATYCPDCRGLGFIRTLSNGDTTCATRDGNGHIEVAHKYFELENNDKRQEIINATPNEHGAVRCPNCNKSFKITSNQSWSGLRHRCGQKIALIDEYANLCHKKNRNE